MDILKRSIEIIFSPVSIMVILLAGGLALSFIKQYRNWSNRLLISGTLLYLLYLFSPLSELLILHLERKYPPLLAPPVSSQIDTIVVLSGYGEEHPTYPVTSNVTDETLCSTAEGIRLYRLLPGAKIVFSGGVLRKGDKPVAGIMADLAEQMAVPATDIVVEGRSQNTYENLVEVKALVGERPFILVAAACSLRRAVAVARKLQMKPTPAPACIRASQHYPDSPKVSDWIVTLLTHFTRPSQARLSLLQLAYHEYLGSVWYWLLGRV
jgi:uncharacterized SAM-binding protein YcdF (DUF218 family)